MNNSHNELLLLEITADCKEIFNLFLSLNVMLCIT